MYVRFDKWEVILRHDVRRGIILGQHFESGFRRRISKKKIMIVLYSMMKKYFFSKTKVKIYYSKRYNMMPMPLFEYNAHFVVILQ